MATIITLPRAAAHPAVVATLAVALFRVAVAPFLTHPGFTDAYYYFIAARNLAAGNGLVTDVIFAFSEAPGFPPLPIPSHRFWMPLATAVQAVGLAVFGTALEPFRAAQLAMTLVAIAIVPATYWLARRLDLAPALAAVVAGVAGLGGVDAAAWSSLDNFAPLAVLGTLLLAALPGVAAGRARDAIAAGIALGLILLARADGVVYALAPVVLARTRPRAVLACLALAALVAAPWYARDVALGIPDGQFARAVLIVRYEDFFRLAPPTLEHYLGALDVALTAKLAALAQNATTFVFATFIVLGPVALLGAWRLRAQPIARAWLGLVLALYLVQSLVFTLHSTQGAYPHSLAGLLPAALALAVAEGARWLRATRGFGALALASGGLALSVVAVAAWPGIFDPPLEARRALVADGRVRAPVLAANAAAWRYALDGPALVTPADGLDVARFVAQRYGARTLVLEPGHFSAYDALYARPNDAPAWLVPVKTDGEIRVWRIMP